MSSAIERTGAFHGLYVLGGINALWTELVPKHPRARVAKSATADGTVTEGSSGKLIRTWGETTATYLSRTINPLE